MNVSESFGKYEMLNGSLHYNLVPMTSSVAAVIQALKMVKSHRLHVSLLDYPEDLVADVDMVFSAQNEVIDLLDVTFGEHVNFIKKAIGKKKCASRFRVGQIIEKIMDGSHA